MLKATQGAGRRAGFEPVADSGAWTWSRAGMHTQSHTLTHSLTHTLTLTITHTHTLSHTHTLTVTQSHTHSHSHNHTHPPSQPQRPQDREGRGAVLDGGSPSCSKNHACGVWALPPGPHVLWAQDVAWLCDLRALRAPTGPVLEEHPRLTLSQVLARWPRAAGTGGR